MVKLVVGNIEKKAGEGKHNNLRDSLYWSIYWVLSVASVRNFPNNYSTQLKKYSLNSFS